MNRVRHVFAATAVGVSCVGALTLLAQTPSPGGQGFIPPIRGQADVDFIRAPTRREGSTLVTKIQVKNMSAAPIAQLTIDET